MPTKGHARARATEEMSRTLLDFSTFRRPGVEWSRAFLYASLYLGPLLKVEKRLLGIDGHLGQRVS